MKYLDKSSKKKCWIKSFLEIFFILHNVFKYVIIVLTPALEFVLLDITAERKRNCPVSIFNKTDPKLLTRTLPLYRSK